MENKSIRWMAVLIVLNLSCATVNLSTEGIDKAVGTTGNINRPYTIISHFSKDMKASFMIFELSTVSNPDLGAAVRNQLIAYQGDAMINLKLKGQTTFVDGLVPIGIGIIGAIIAPPYGSYASALFSMRTYTVEGDIIKYTDGEKYLGEESKRQELDQLVGKRMKIVLKSFIEITGTIIKNQEKWIVLKKDDGGVSNIARDDVKEMIPQ